jgi:hypothetical protein
MSPSFWYKAVCELFSILLYNYLLEMTSPQVPTALPAALPQLHNRYSESCSKPSVVHGKCHPCINKRKKRSCG